jgi:ATP-dependent Clp protease protease subunit
VSQYRYDDEDDDDDQEKDEQKSERGFSFIEQALFKRRRVLITGQVTDKLARATCEKLLALSSENDQPINVFISSPGGHVESGDMIHDVLKFIKPEIRTIGSGWVASAGALVFVAAERKHRYCLPNTRFLLHQPSGGVGGRASDIYIQAEQIRIMRERLNRIFAEATGQPIERIEKDTERDFWLTPKEAIDYGLLGSVITSETEIDF